MNSRKESFAIMGISSWIGSVLAKKAWESGVPAVAGTVRNNRPDLSAQIKMHKATSPAEQLSFLKTYRPTVLFNLLRGEEEEDFRLHVELSEHCRKSGYFYVYASSVLALDGYKDTELTEDFSARSISSYGIFKGRCEDELGGVSAENALLLRFASIQGWVSHKATRNQVFLEKMQRGEEITVDRGVLQNRLSDFRLVNMILQLVADRCTGIRHLGTIDASDEVDYLKKQAELFGYDSDLVKTGGERNVNLFAKPGRILSDYGDRFRFSERDTLHALLCEPGLQQYKAFGH